MPPPRLSLCLLALALAAGCLARAERPAPPPGKLTPGLTSEEVLLLLGPPTHVSRQVYLHRSLEQWDYAAPRRLRLTFACRRGEKATLQKFRSLAPPEG